jgi:glutamine amidotransferase
MTTISSQNKKVAIIDYGAGNLRSVTNAVVYLGYQPQVTSDAAKVIDAAAVILPGVGAAADTMQSLTRAGLDRAIHKVVDAGKPLFAVCVGFQILFSITDEGGKLPCLGIIQGEVKKLPLGLKIPHMGWNLVNQRIDHPIFNGIPNPAYFYFVHSYFATPWNQAVIAGTTEYGSCWCSMVKNGSVVATQFHPEKSGPYGLRMYKNFLESAL